MIKYVLTILLSLIYPFPALSKVMINLHWTRVEVESQPKSSMHITKASSSYIIDGDIIKTPSGNASAHLGKSASGVNSYNAEYTVNYHIAGGTIYIQRNFEGSIEYETIKTDGEQSCTSSITYGPLPGKPFMRSHRISNGELMIIDSETSDFIDCQIKKIE